LKIFLDANVPMYAAGSDHPNRAGAQSLIRRVSKGEIDACTSTEILQEVFYRYTNLGLRQLAIDVYDSFVEICPVVLPVTLADTDRARDLLSKHASLTPRDAIHAAVMLNHDVTWIATFDTDFDRVPGIRRMVPA
jgi:predicted nucleic acid-binding protein